MIANTLYLAQHGLAVDKAEDPERPLSATGISQTKTIAAQLQASAITVSTIFHSGKLRALQTAEIFAHILQIETLSATQHLSPNDDVSHIAQTLTDGALYIGHLPHLQKLTAYLVTGDEQQSVITFRNSAVICLQQADNKTPWQVQWYITPALTTIATTTAATRQP